MTLEGITPFRDHLVLKERRQGLEQLSVYRFDDGSLRSIEMPDPISTVRPEASGDFDSTKLRFDYSSLLTPWSTYDYDLETGQLELKKRDRVPGFDSDLYRVERRWATAPDGARIPISMVHRKDIELDGDNPTLLYGYGSYGVNIPPTFSADRLSLLDRGVVFAIAHPRGSSTMGKGWYEDGKLLNKKNTFTDFIASAEHLIESGFTKPERLAVMGGSAGGLLMGAVTNLRPDLFKAVVAHVPFVDVINTMLDPDLPLTEIEYEEWGNPSASQTSYEYMKSYSPYDNVSAQDYPTMLITGGLNDPRVSYWEPAKWTAKIRELKTDTNHQLLKINMGAGHGGQSGRDARLKERAFEYAYILDSLGS